MRHSKTSVLAILSLAFTLSTCRHGPDTDEYSTISPTQTIAGIYRPTLETLNFIKARKYQVKNTFIELKPDSSFIFHAVPDMWNTDFGDSENGYDTGSGTWSIRNYRKYRWITVLDFDESTQFHNKAYQKGFWTDGCMLFGEKQPYTLSLSVGEDDELEFRQQF